MYKKENSKDKCADCRNHICIVFNVSFLCILRDVCSYTIAPIAIYYANLLTHPLSFDSDVRLFV